MAYDRVPVVPVQIETLRLFRTMFWVSLRDYEDITGSRAECTHMLPSVLLRVLVSQKDVQPQTVVIAYVGTHSVDASGAFNAMHRPCVSSATDTDCVCMSSSC